MVGVNISHSYFHPGGAHITRVKIISHTGTDDDILFTLCKNATIHQLTSFKNVLFPGHNHQTRPSTSDPDDLEITNQKIRIVRIMYIVRNVYIKRNIIV